MIRALTVAAGILYPAMGQAGDASVVWGTQSGASSENALSSSLFHRSGGEIAIQENLGRDAPAPGTALTSIGSFNNISIEGDGNTLESTQDANNDGSVSSVFRSRD